MRTPVTPGSTCSHAKTPSSAQGAGGRSSRPASPSPSHPGTPASWSPRSGLALRHGIGVVNAPGLIDSAYRGEVKVILLNTDPNDDYLVHRGDRIAQLVVQRVEEVAWQVVDELDGHDRGGGFGHSGR